jgi:CheY-like chemotaxis protein/anti-sigma regulatory factor (Ser/Thr protein kinase)
MIKILVVDDNEMDRVLVTHLLSDLYEFVYASDGVQGLELCESEEPDLVVTDLVMPNMDGMQLLRQLQSRFPDIPVIMMTSEGSEATASEAIDCGAASYVPKRQLSDKLSQTVNQVVDLMRADRDYLRLLERLTYSRYAFKLENDLSLIEPLVEFVQQIAFAEGICTQGNRHRLGVALDEALFNAIYHGNLQLPIEHMQSVRNSARQDTPNRLVQDRCKDATYGGRRVLVYITCTVEQIKVVIEDEGKGFDHSHFARENRAHVNSDQHRGILLIASIMDEVIYNEEGNCVTLIKKRESSQEEV